MEEEKLIEQAKKISVKEAAAYSLMDGFGLRYITPFANSLGASNTIIGLLTSVPSLLGNLAQLLTPRMMEKYSRKRLVFWGVLLQSFMWLALIGLSIVYFNLKISNNLASLLLVFIYTILIVFGAFSGPAWSSWMKDLVTKDRGNYFGRRSRIAGALALIFMFISGFILDYFKQTNIFIAFIILFSLAFLGRGFSTILFTKQYEPKLKLKEGYYFSLLDFVKKMPFNNFGRFTIFIALINFASSIASPFFAIYLLDNLKLKSVEFGYIFYTIIVLTSSLTTLLIMTSWGKFADKYGNFRVMKLCAYFIPLVPLFWFLSYFLIGKFSLIYVVLFLVIGECISGIIWAGFNLAAGNYIYDAVTSDRMAICVAYYSVINGFGVFLGATLGGVISSFNFYIFGLSSLLVVFLLSAIARYIVVKAMVNRIKEVREGVQEFKMRNPIRQVGAPIQHFYISHLFSGLHNQIVKPRITDLN